MHNVLMPESTKQNNKAKMILQHLFEAWGSWRAKMPWKVPGMPTAIENIILWLSSESLGHLLCQTGEAAWLSEGWPASMYKHDMKLLVSAIEKPKEAYPVNGHPNQPLWEELALFEQGYDNPHESYNNASWKGVLNSLILTISSSHVTTTKPVEKIADVASKGWLGGLVVRHPSASGKTQVRSLVWPVFSVQKYLDQFLFFEASKQGLFPAWIKPVDTEPPPLLFTRVYEKIDLVLLNCLICLIMNHKLADYSTMKSNIVLTYKDMAHTNAYSLIHGLQFLVFVFQYYGLVLDLLVLGL
ncbi:RNA recognition motif of the spliceosomal PrP8-domain-containing protein [Pisolithus sp. B1]|nr:RNA recognition motif of the spliceosomal PrP8-domain-containing protein [Pisolithus sp. B1]